MTSQIDLKRALLAALTAVGLVFALLVVYGGPAMASAGPAECQTGIQASGGKDVRTFTADEGEIVDGVCIKSGNLHTGALGNGLHEDGCYQVSGVGTQTVTVRRVQPGPDCQDLSHVDVLVSDEPPPTTAPTTEPTTPTTIPDEVSPTSIVSTTDPGATTTDPGVSTTAEVSDETLPFTGFENGTTGLLALVLVASGVLALVGTRVFREETDE